MCIVLQMTNHVGDHLVMIIEQLYSPLHVCVVSYIVLLWCVCASHCFRKTVVCPIIDVISDDTFEYMAGSDMTYGGFNWKLNFRWYPVPQREMDRRKGDRTLPVRSDIPHKHPALTRVFQPDFQSLLIPGPLLSSWHHTLCWTTWKRNFPEERKLNISCITRHTWLQANAACQLFRITYTRSIGPGHRHSQLMCA